MIRFWIFTITLVTAMLLVFFIVQGFDVPFLKEDPQFLLSQKQWVAALIGTGLLIVDVIAPVPASVIMFVNGVLFGPVLGTFISLIGGMLASIFGYFIGVYAERAGKRWIGEEALARTAVFFKQYGIVAVIASRPVPILSEAISIIGGMSRMPFRPFLIGSFLGILPAAILYAIAGAYAVDFNSGLITFLIVIAISGAGWIFAKWFTKSSNDATSLS
jgi:uncharacterized membrane protein YdjX (TVP38/TMEM64 family)